MLEAQAAPPPAVEGPSSGVVKWFDQAKGFGVIRPDRGGREVFVHVSAVERSGLATLVKGQQVSFKLGPDAGRRAEAASLALRG
ncbi:MAG: cold shock domain-containing protein [Caulobacteraceae bacterium]|nr:cold shock domain-containing protein [Caulobacteraceae bacterium]